MAGGAIQTVGPVVFDYVWFQARYPDLSEWCNPEMAQGYFDLACLFCDNGNGQQIAINGSFFACRWSGPAVRDIPRRQMLLGLLTAHIAKMFAPLDGSPASSTVGRISSATEGSISVAFEFPNTPGAEWYNQTKYGAMFWAATSIYRMGRYYPGPDASYSFGRGRGFRF